MADRPPESRTGGPADGFNPAHRLPPLFALVDGSTAAPSLAPTPAASSAPILAASSPTSSSSPASVHTLETNGQAPPLRIDTTGGFWALEQGKGPAGYRYHFIPAGRSSHAYKQPEQTGWKPGDPDGPAASAGETSWRHSWWADERGQLRAALARTGAAGRVLERWDNCGSDCWVRVHKTTGDLALSANTCRHRWCKPCGITRANLIGGNLAAELKRRRFQKFAHIVLTLKSTDHPLREQKAHIYRAFRDLRRIKLGTVPRAARMRGRVVNWWNSWVRGGAAFLEVTLNQKAGSKDFGRWHVHLHIIAQSRWLPAADLRSLWAGVTRDDAKGFPASSIVWVERIDDAGGAAAEVSKYAAKGIDSSIAGDPNKVDELLVSLKGVRLCYTFGAWRGFKLTAAPEFDPSEWISLGRLDDVIARAAAGEDRAAHILELLRGEKRGQTGRPPPSPANFHPN